MTWEAALRLGIFLLVLLVVASLEFWRPKRSWREARKTRWGINLGLIGLNVILQRLTLGAAAVLMAVHAQSEGWGLLNLVDWPGWLTFLVGLLLLDLAIYLQHVLAHALPFFWRLHQVHHADLDLDVTSGLRFHPLEILLSLIYKVLVVAALGLNPLTVLVFEALLNAASMFSHANIRLHPRLEQVLRWFIITPDMHRIHHSVYRQETDSNFGFFLSVWDRLLGTYTQAPRDGHLQMDLGLAPYRDQTRLGLVSLLMMPFRSPGGGSQSEAEEAFAQRFNRHQHQQGQSDPFKGRGQEFLNTGGLGDGVPGKKLEKLIQQPTEQNTDRDNREQIDAQRATTQFPAQYPQGRQTGHRSSE